MPEKIINVCEKCGKEDVELFSHVKMVDKHFVVWVCEGCFEILEDVLFDNFGVEHLLGDQK